MLVVIARPNALDVSPWVLQEVKEFASTGREPIFVEVGTAFQDALAAPNPTKLSGWIAARQELLPDGTKCSSVLRIRDKALDTGPNRVPAQSVSEEIA